MYNVNKGKTLLYVDGDLKQTVPRAAVPIQLTGGRLGGWKTGDASERHADLQLGSFRVWASERDGVDSCPTGAEKDLLLFYSFNDCGDKLVDKSGFGTDGTVDNAQWVEASIPQKCKEPGKPP